MSAEHRIADRWHQVADAARRLEEARTALWTTVAHEVRSGWITQAEAGELIGVSQQRVSQGIANVGDNRKGT